MVVLCIDLEYSIYTIASLGSIFRVVNNWLNL